MQSMLTNLLLFGVIVLIVVGAVLAGPPASRVGGFGE